jgi:hypothetical protein
MTLAPAERARIKAEEGPSTLAVARAEPLEVARGAAEGVLRQDALVAVVEPLPSPAEGAIYPFWRHTKIFVHDRECAGLGRCAPLF